jgi:hypothetical protein
MILRSELKLPQRDLDNSLKLLVIVNYFEKIYLQKYILEMTGVIFPDKERGNG